MLEGSPREQPTSLMKRLSANSKLKNGYNSQTHNHTKIDTRGNSTLKVQHWYALWYSNPKIRLVRSLIVFDKICIGGMVLN
jgi:hypothetical protein